MFDRVTISALLKTVIAVLGIAVLAMLSNNVWGSWTGSMRRAAPRPPPRLQLTCSRRCIIFGSTGRRPRDLLADSQVAATATMIRDAAPAKIRRCGPLSSRSAASISGPPGHDRGARSAQQTSVRPAGEIGSGLPAAEGVAAGQASPRNTPTRRPPLSICSTTYRRRSPPRSSSINRSSIS